MRLQPTYNNYHINEIHGPFMLTLFYMRPFFSNIRNTTSKRNKITKRLQDKHAFYDLSLTKSTQKVHT